MIHTAKFIKNKPQQKELETMLKELTSKTSKPARELAPDFMKGYIQGLREVLG